MNDQSDKFFAKATSWTLNQSEQDGKSRRTAWITAAALGTIAVLEGLAMLFLTPLKTVVPLPILVDSQTGYVQRLGPDGTVALRANDALVRSMLAQYVMAREGFDIDSIGFEYHNVMLWSAGQARADYAAIMPKDNPDSPFQRYSRRTVVEARVSGISPIAKDTYLVRFTTAARGESAATEPPKYWSAVVTYRFTDAGMAVEDRFQNPLGFQVVKYHRDPDAAPPVSSTLTIAPASAPVAQSPAATNNQIPAAQPAAPTMPLQPYQPAQPALQARSAPPAPPPTTAPIVPTPPLRHQPPFQHAPSGPPGRSMDPNSIGRVPGDAK
ncbi:MAG: hypothetical protein KGM49_02840 [Sphingomonadales bacterium]|nr:hypothetical protein [Sphingomonadales bacterium]